MVALNGAQKFIRISSNLRTPLQVQGPSLSPFYRQGDRGSEGLRKCAVVGTAMRGTACGPGSRHPKARTTPPSDTELRGGLRAGPPWPGSRPNSVFYSHHEGQLEPKCPQGKRRASRSWVSPGFHTENEAVHVSILKKGTVTGRPRQRPPSPQSVLGTIARPHTCFCLVHRALIFFFFFFIMS